MEVTQRAALPAEEESQRETVSDTLKRRSGCEDHREVSSDTL